MNNQCPHFKTNRKFIGKLYKRQDKAQTVRHILNCMTYLKYATRDYNAFLILIV